MGWKQRGSGVLSPARLQVAYKEMEVLRLRRAGMTLAQVASQLGYADASGARKAEQRALVRCLPRSVEDEALLEKLRLEDLWHAAWKPDVLSWSMAEVDVAVAILHKLDRLTGYGTVPFDLDADGPGTESKSSRMAGNPGEWTEALRLRADGCTFEEIAIMLNLGNPGTAYRVVDRDYRRWLAEAADPYLEEVLTGIDNGLRAVWADATASPPKLTAVRKALKYHDARYKALRLDRRVAPRPRKRPRRRPRQDRLADLRAANHQPPWANNPAAVFPSPARPITPPERRPPRRLFEPEPDPASIDPAAVNPDDLTRPGIGDGWTHRG